jgi:hypothetical protein
MQTVLLAHALPYTFQDLVDAASAAAITVWPGTREFALELALVLAMPEAADVALTRLVREAGTRITARNYDEVVLLSADTGLAGDVGECIRSAACRWREPEGTPQGWWRWKRPSLEEPLRRAYRPVGGIREQRRSSLGPTVILDSAPAVGDWLAMPVQVDHTLAELCRQVEQGPARLTQIGMTRTSARSIARILDLAAGRHPTLAEAEPTDGIEVVGPGTVERDATGVRVEEASVPHGAVRLEWGDPTATATVRTRLWCALLRAMVQARCPPLRADGTIDDDRVLGAAGSFTSAQVSAQVKVRFYRRGREGDAVCAVLSPPTSPPPAWWYRKGKATAKRTVGTPLVVAEPIDDVAAQVTVRAGAVQLCAVDPQGPLTMLRPAQPYFLGSATDARGRFFAVLSIQGPLESGAQVRGTPIARVPQPGPAGARLRPVWNILQSLPIVVSP